MGETDPRWVRDGRELREWLLDLVHADAPVRRRAENAVSAMHWGAPVADQTVYQHLPKDWDGHRKEFFDQIAAILSDPTFPAQQYIQRVIARRLEDSRIQSELSRLQTAFFDVDDMDEGARDRLLNQMARLRAELEAGQLANSMGTLALATVLEQAGAVLCQMPEVTRDALRDGACRNSMAKALGKVGPAAHAFLAELDGGSGPFVKRDRLAQPVAAASVGRDDPQFVERLIEGLRRRTPEAIWVESTALAHLGTRAAELRPQVVDELLALIGDEEHSMAVLRCIGQVAPARRDAFERVLELARAAPPDLRPVPDFPTQMYDARAGVRGIAIEALGHFDAFAAEAVPVLVDAIDTFAEYDPDWGYENDEHGRVIASLEELLPAATAAVPTLVRHILQTDGSLDRPVVRLLGKIGPAAREALPVLRRIAEEDGVEDWVRNPPAEALDPVGWAIARIEGRL